MKKLLSLFLSITLLSTIVSMSFVTAQAQVGDKFVFEAEDCFGEYDATSKISYSTGSYSGWNADCTALDSAKQKFLIHSSNCADVGQYITFNLTGLEQGSYELYFGHRQATGRSTYKVEAWDSSNAVQLAGENVDFAVNKAGTNITSLGSYFFSVKTSNEVTVKEGNSLTLKMTITSIPKTGVSGFYMDKILLVKTADYEAPAKEAVSTVAEASIRLGDVNGIRFYTTVDEEALAELVGTDDYEIGTIIAPADLLGDDGELTAEDDCRIVPFKARTEDGNIEYFNAANKEIAGSLVAIKDGNIARDFAARAYVKVGETYYYSSTTATRSLKTVASAMQSDTANYEALSAEHKAMVDAWAAGNPVSAE